MTFQVTAPNALQNEAARVDAAQVVRLNIVEQNRPVLPVGKLLEVVVADNNRMQLGVMLQGQFFPALLPKGYQPGDKLRVQVQANQDALVLRILGGASTENSTPVTRVPNAIPLQNLLSLLLPESGTKNIEQALRAIHIAQNNSATTPGTPTTTPEILTRLAQILVSKNTLLTSESLNTPDRTATVLTTLAERALTSSVNEAAQAVKQLTQKGNTSPHTRLTAAVSEFLQSLLQREESLGLDPHALALRTERPSSGQEVRQNLSISAALSQYAVATGQGEVLERVGTALQQKAEAGHPLMLLIKLLTKNNSPTTAESAPLSPFVQPEQHILDELVREFTHLYEQRADDASVRQTIKKALQNLSALHTRNSERGLAETFDERPLQSARTLEQMLSGQESFNQMNPVLRSCGEPSVLLVPIMLGGTLVPLEILLHPPQVDPDQGQQHKESRTQGFERIELRLTLPSLGTLAVEVAYRAHELMATFSTNSAEALAILETRLPELAKRLSEHGFEDPILRAQRSETSSKLVARLTPARATVAVA